MAQTQKFQGIMRVSVMPFKNGEPNLDGLIKIAEEPRKAGVTNEFHLGNTAEAKFLTLEQKELVIDFMPKLKAHGINTLVGTTGDTLEETKDLTKRAENAGVDGIVIIPGYKSQLTPLEYAEKIIEAQKLPVWVYINRAINENQLELGSLKLLFLRYGGMIGGVKISILGDAKMSDDISYLRNAQKFAFNSAPGLRTFLGSEEIAFDRPDLVGDGIVSSSANKIPAQMVGLYNAIKEGKLHEFDGREIRELHRRYALPGNSPAKVLKEDLAAMGIITSPELSPRNPLYKKP